jgi:auxin-responsive protein IAA
MKIHIYLFFFDVIVPSCELNGLGNKEVDGPSDDNNFILFYDNVDGDRFFLGEVPWE